jgi:gamma-glutamyltranspeptidase/glutathione hydrolase
MDEFLPKMKNLLSLLCIIISALFLPYVTYGQYEVSKSASGQHGMVVSPHPLATKVGLEILKGGGNAYDAGIAIEFALAVCFPVAGNIGGGGFGLYRTSAGEVLSLDYRERAPSQASTKMYLDAKGQVMDSLSRLGALAVGVPGTVKGMEQLHRKLGKLPWATLLQPAINLASDGFALTVIDSDLMFNHAQKFKQVNAWPTPFVKQQGRRWRMGDTLKQPMLAKTLRTIQENGSAGFYEGWVAASIVTEMKRHNGLISTEDLKSYKAIWRDPIKFDYQAPTDTTYRIYSMAPPSSGGVILNQVLGMLNHIPKSDWLANKDNHVWRIQQLVETERLAYADRSEYLGDPDFFQIPVRQLLDKSYLKSRFPHAHVGPAINSLKVGPGLGNHKMVRQPNAGSQPKEHDETTHYTVVDGQGNALCTTTTLNGAFGSKLVVEGSGILLNNEMDDFSANPGSPNSYGLIGGVANAIEPRKRMLSSMSPTIITRLVPSPKGSTEMLAFTVGTPGGSTIPTSVLQVILGLTVDGLSPAEAVAKPRYHHQWFPDQILSEYNSIIPERATELGKLGYTIKLIEKIGRVEAIKISIGGLLVGGADPRGDDSAAGY